MGAPANLKYHYSSYCFTYSVTRGSAALTGTGSSLSGLRAVTLRGRQASGGEFGWGGTSVKR